MFGIYVHWPYCVKKCPYCAFNSHLSETIDPEQWKNAFKKELERIYKHTSHQRPDSVFFGGGTPSIMPPSITEFILSTIEALWGHSNNIEITLEANPITCSEKVFSDFKSAGINRISLGVQSLNDTLLAFLGRQHNRQIAISAIKSALKIFDNVSYDIIYALPQQSLKSWRHDLQEIISFAPNHISLYQLTIEQQTPFAHAVKKGDWTPMEENLQAKMLRMTWQMLTGWGFDNYEISNFARDNRHCVHNSIYWQYDDFIGVGPGAHGRITIDDTKYSTKSFRAPQKWLQTAQEHSAIQEFMPLSTTSVIQEYLLMALRVKEGIYWEKLETLGRKNRHDLINMKQLSFFSRSGFLVIRANGFSLTEKARLITDALAKELAL